MEDTTNSREITQDVMKPLGKMVAQEKGGGDKKDIRKQNVSRHAESGNQLVPQQTLPGFLGAWSRVQPWPRRTPTSTLSSADTL